MSTSQNRSKTNHTSIITIPTQATKNKKRIRRRRRSLNKARFKSYPKDLEPDSLFETKRCHERIEIEEVLEDVIDRRSKIIKF